MKIQKYIPILYTAIFSTVLFCLLLFFRGFYPFGSGSVMLTDMYDECVPSLYRFYDIMHGYKNIFYEFQASGGLNLYTETINEICNPFNYLLLFGKRDNIYLAVNIVLMLYVVGAACTSHFFLNHMWGESKKLNTLLSTCYAFSGYMAYNFQILRWMILPVIFPLFMLACIRLWKEEKGALYAILLAYQIILSVQHGYMTLLFCLFASGIWMYCVESKRTRKKMCLNVGIYTFAGIALSAIVLLPTIFTLTSSSRSGANASYFAVFEQFGIKDLFERLFQFCHPVLLGILVVIIYKLLKEHKFKMCWEKPITRFYVILNSFLVFTVLLQPANLLWHMGSYVCFPVRYGYMLVFVLICLIKSLVENTAFDDDRKNSYFWVVIKIIITVGVVAATVILLKINEKEIVRGFCSLAISDRYIKETCIVAVALFLMFIVSMISFGRTIASRISLAFILIACSICYFNMISLPESFRTNQEIIYQTMLDEYRNPEVNSFSELIIREKHNPEYPRNASLINAKSSMSGYFPTAEVIYQYKMGDLGYLTPWVSTVDVGGTKISDYFFNHVTFLSTENANIQFEEKRPLENQKKILDAIFSGEMEFQDEVFEIIYKDNLTSTDDGRIEIYVQETSTIYVDTEAYYQDLIVLINDQQISLPMAYMQDEPHILLCLGTYDTGKVSIEIFDKEGNTYSSENIKIGVLDENKWEQLTRIKQFDANIFEVNSKMFSCKITATEKFQEGTVVLPINAAEGWEVFVDGEKQNIKKIGSCFIGLELDQGQHEIELQFFPPYFREGGFISLLALGMLLILCLIKKHKGIFEMLNGTAAVSFLIVLWGAVVVIYVIPGLGVAFHFIKRILNMVI